MTKSKSKAANAGKVSEQKFATDVMDTMPTVQYGVEQATEISSLTGQGESIKAQIQKTALEWFAPFAEAGADETYLKVYSEKNEKNNLKRYVRDYFVEACSVAVVGRSGLAFLQDKNNSPEAEFTATEGTLAGQQPRSKKYIQQQYGKIISSVGAAIKQAAKDAEDGVDSNAPKEKTKKTDCDRALEGIAKANSQAKKKKPDGSMSDALIEACSYLYDISGRLKSGESFADIVHADYFE